ncbi:hypothetical protein SAMN05661091_2225 [Paenibacillus uliginis N3/975]|uniref:Uncharacterized protein n=1 Tax=Paenibacillus uliginis N3/975 TaxID=1313296 RepID=A0A1X7HAK0_9BACL|nr:hypothetical protein [Paenibacillus uliginis]SMF82703.1 hypothetical protein SAMN05661091_2225 [Paenibacillus uliginis N3/975]
MHIISPLSEDSCRPYIGRQVCAVLHDGRHVTGTLRGVSERGLLFEEAYPNANILSTKSGKTKKQLNSKNKKAETSAFGPGFGYGGFGYGGFGAPFAGALAWSSIALLFLIPFLFI